MDIKQYQQKYQADYYRKHRAEKLEYAKHHKETNRQKILAFHQHYYQTHRENWIKSNAKRTLRYSIDPIFRAKRLKQRQDNYERRRLKVLSAYSAGTLSCIVCGFNDVRALNIDHINEVGSKHKNRLGGCILTKYLIDNNYPPGYQVLCSNCNAIKEYNRRRKNGLKV